MVVMINIFQRLLRTDMHYLLKNGGWVMFGQGTTAIFSFISAVVFANLIAPEAYGTYKYFLTIFTFLSLATLLGMETAVLQAVAKGITGTYQTALRVRFRWGVLGTIGSLGLAGFYWYQGNEAFALTFFLFALVVPFMHSLTLWRDYLTGTKEFHLTAKRSTVNQAVISILSISTLVATRDIYPTLAVYVVSTIVAHWLSHRWLVRKYPESQSPGDHSESLQFGKRMSLSLLPARAAGHLDSIILWHFIGPIALAQYSFAQATANPVNKLLKSFIVLSIPKFSTTSTTTLHQTLPRKILLAMVLLLPLVGLYILILPYLYSYFFAQYLESVQYAVALGLLMVLSPMRLLASSIETRDDKRALYFINSVLPFLRVGAMLLFIPIFGIWGIIYAQVINLGISNCTLLFLFKRSK